MKNVLAALALVLVTAGCAALGSHSQRSNPFASSAERTVEVYVENGTLEDVRIEALGPGRRHELGMVNARSTRRLSVPWSELQELRFHVDPIAGRRVTTRGVPVGPGERISLVIVTPLERSFIRR